MPRARPYISPISPLYLPYISQAILLDIVFIIPNFFGNAGSMLLTLTLALNWSPLPLPLEPERYP